MVPTCLEREVSFVYGLQDRLDGHPKLTIHEIDLGQPFAIRIALIPSTKLKVTQRGSGQGMVLIPSLGLPPIQQHVSDSFHAKVWLTTSLAVNRPSGN